MNNINNDDNNNNQENPEDLNGISQDHNKAENNSNVNDIGLYFFFNIYIFIFKKNLLIQTPLYQW